MKRIKFILLVLSCFIFSSTVSAKKKDNDYVQWATTIANSEMKHNPELWQADFLKKPKWDYTQGLISKSLIELYKVTKDTAYFNYVQEFTDFFIDSTGTIMTYKMSDYNIDRLNGGKFLFDMFTYTKDTKYIKAIAKLRAQLKTHPRVSLGGFWHKKRYPNQMWLDGLYMGAPFYAQCAEAFNEGDESWNDITNQFILVDSVTLDKKTGLNYHGWDESREQRWSDSITGCSPHFWSRAMGWYMMAMVDVLDFLPKKHPQREQIIKNLNRLAAALVKFQDEETGMWYQVVDLGGKEGNYVESSGTAMFIYAMAKGVNMKYLPKEFRDTASKAFCGLTANATQKNEDGTTSITKACGVAGLGGKPYRDGSYEYYINEIIRNDDPKVVGPFILAALEMNKLCK